MSFDVRTVSVVSDDFVRPYLFYVAFKHMNVSFAHGCPCGFCQLLLRIINSVAYCCNAVIACFSRAENSKFLIWVLFNSHQSYRLYNCVPTSYRKDKFLKLVFVGQLILVCVDSSYFKLVLAKLSTLFEALQKQSLRTRILMSVCRVGQRHHQWLTPFKYCLQCRLIRKCRTALAVIEETVGCMLLTAMYTKCSALM